MMRQIAGAFAEYEKALPSGKYQMHRRTLLKVWNRTNCGGQIKQSLARRRFCRMMWASCSSPSTKRLKPNSRAEP